MENYTFQKAVPVWEAGSGTVMNRWLQFRTEAKGGQPVVLALTGSSAYVVKVNGVFAAFGPARSAHGFYRVDELPLTALCDREKNVITVTVMGYNCTSFYHLCQPSFLCFYQRRGIHCPAYDGARREGGAVQLPAPLCGGLQSGFLVSSV